LREIYEFADVCEQGAEGIIGTERVRTDRRLLTGGY
jgi:hypothetical protein